MWDPIFLKRSHGMVRVEVKGCGEFRIQSVGEPLGMIVANAGAILLGEIVVVSTERDLPYELVSFDEAKNRIEVRRKKAV